MAPRVKIKRECIIEAGVELIRRGGAESINARSIAKYLGCSTQPVFSNFATMEELHKSILTRVDEIYKEYTLKEMERTDIPPYKAVGTAYIRFAKEEKQLFMHLFMRRRNEGERQDDSSLEGLYDMMERSTGLSPEGVRLLHLENWAFVHGIAAMIVTDYLDLTWELIEQMMTDVYQGILGRLLEEEGHESH
ncbi:MAG: TetR/AcrR family transcriptional regulator [Clostridiales bacterium]|nr:TetR/AcrR family transcriptional regulator [Clostridiales bacterium]